MPVVLAARDATPRVRTASVLTDLEVAKLANYIHYRQHDDALPPDWVLDRSLAEQARTDTNTGRQLTDDCIMRKESGIAVAILRNDEKKTVAVSFAGTPGGKIPADGLKRGAIKNAHMVAVQLNKIRQCRNGVSDDMVKANAITGSVLQQVNDKYTDYEVELVGQSKGGLEAVYVVLKQEKRLFASVTATPLFPSKIAEQFNPAKLEAAQSQVREFHVEGDYVTKPPFTWFWPGTQIGSRQAIPPTVGTSEGLIKGMKVHIHMNEHMVGHDASEQDAAVGQVA